MPSNDVPEKTEERTPHGTSDSRVNSLNQYHHAESRGKVCVNPDCYNAHESNTPCAERNETDHRTQKCGSCVDTGMRPDSSYCSCTHGVLLRFVSDISSVGTDDTHDRLAESCRCNGCEDAANAKDEDYLNAECDTPGGDNEGTNMSKRDLADYYGFPYEGSGYDSEC